jgi:CDP-2,3-bis-(O-geranylgeranyl)-sn-glycerol synthase
MAVNMEIAKIVIDALKFIFPAYCANAVPVIAGGGSPIDFGRKFIDGKPVFGKNKTFRGFFFGLAIGLIVGYAEALLFGYPLFLGLLTSLGALFGDLTGAFMKRRLGLAPGDILPVVDQVDFIVGAVLVSLPVYGYMLYWELVLAVLIITPPIHLLDRKSVV